MMNQLEHSNFYIYLLIWLLAFIISDLIEISGPIIITTNAISIKEECLNQTCGNISGISYPFGLATKPECPVLSPFFNLSCNASTGKELLYLFHDLKYHGINYTTIQVMSIQTDNLILNITTHKVNLYNQTTCEFRSEDRRRAWRKFAPVGVGPYVLSNDNVFGSFGSAFGAIYTSNVVEKNHTKLYLSGGEAVGGCAIQLPDNANNSVCGNFNCCMSEMPNRIYGTTTNFSPRYFSVSVDGSPFLNFTQISKSSPPCDDSYAALFHPNHTDFKSYFGLKVNWAIPLPSNFTDFRDTESIINRPDYVCAKNDSGGVSLVVLPEINGYRCACRSGFTGDGYYDGSGCKDIDECKIAHNCIAGKATCENLNGSYICKCKSVFHEGDGLSYGSGCKISQTTIHVVSIGGGFLGFMIMICSIILVIKWWKHNTKKYHFLQNGGLQLHEFMRSRGRETFRFFTHQELKNATNNFVDANKIGVGGFGAVFKGSLEDGRSIAIKKAKHGDGDNEQFLNEMDILTQINHRHIVKVLGCCLETSTPLLVYEYVSNGSLEDNLQRKRDGTLLTWLERLVIARQTAEALAYLHGDISPPVFHRDVKPGNILLDDKWNAKVADFGVSRLLPDGNEHVSTVVQGTLGYLDPEYFQTLQLSDKSDVYSFGVVLVELITCLKPVDNQNRNPEFCNLVTLFMHHMKMETLQEIIDPNIELSASIMTPIDELTIKPSIMAVASLAYSCLALDGCGRPTMRDVAITLQQIFQSFVHTQDTQSEDNIPLLPRLGEHENYNAMKNVMSLQDQYEFGSYSLSIGNLNITTMPR